MMTPAQFFAFVGTVFGWQWDYPEDGQYGYHHGTDLPWGRGTSIPSPVNGVVIAKGYNSALGHYVVIQFGTDLFMGFSHMNSASPLALGEAVYFGGLVGYVGDTGEAAGPHLHLTVSSSVYPGAGPWSDPMTYLAALLNTSGAAGSSSRPLPTPEKEEEEMAQNAGISWTRKADGASCAAIVNTTSGLFNDWEGADGGYNTAMAQAFGVPYSFAPVSESHAEDLRANCAEVRQGK